MTVATPTVLSLDQLSTSFGGSLVVEDFHLDIAEGEFLTLLGPSGCGKTTLLRLIAGFERPDRGRVLLDGVDIAALPPERRPVNLVFQSYALFPHLSVYENVAFSLRLKRVPLAEVQARVKKVLVQTRLEEFTGRLPHQLSGGQQQRVAMARAIINHPRLLLLDEPLSALDARLRSEMQLELKRLQRELGITTILVTHEQDEALSLSDRVVVMNQGRIAQVGTPREIYEEPASLWVARFIGDINLLPGRVERRFGRKGVEIRALGQSIRLETDATLAPGDRVQILLRPEDLRLAESIAEGMVRYPGTIVERRYRGATLDTTIELDRGPTVQVCEFFDEDDPDFDYRLGERIAVSWVRGWEVVLRDEE